MADEKTTQAGATESDTTKAADTKAADAASDKGGDDIEALKKQNQALLAELTSKKSELKDYRGKYETLQSEKDANEAEKLKEQGKYKELLEKEQAKNKSYQKQVLNAQLHAFAFKEGIIDSDLINAIPTDKIKITEVNDSIEISGAEDAVKAYKASKPHLFKVAETAAAADTTASTTTTTGKATGAAVTDPNSAGNTTNAVAAGVKPGSKEAKELEKAFLAKYSH